MIIYVIKQAINWNDGENLTWHNLYAFKTREETVNQLKKLRKFDEETPNKLYTHSYKFEAINLF